ncbi:MAG: winged helix DNA-binding domain-containing protein [Chloroflexi bacterium]|nr:MAG: winged helix DNA-binding domain-containing protein [Chloroflexota bacterium]
MAISVTAEQMRWFRLQRSGLVAPFATPEQAADTLFGIQAQILPAGALALWNRTNGLTEARFNDLLYTERTLVKLWGQRGTLHLYASRDWPLLYAARSINRTWNEQQVVDKERARHEALIEQVAALLKERETLGRGDLRAAGLDLNDHHYSAWGGIFADLVRRGYACHAGRVGNEGRFAHRERWLPNLAWNPPGADEANTEVMRRFFAAYGPATMQDFSYWRYVPQGQTRSWQQTLAAELAEVEVEGRRMFVLRRDLDELLAQPPERAAWPVKMLYRFDPYLLAHKDKAWVADTAFYKQIWRPAGHIEGIVLVHGRAVATWRYDRKGRGLVVTVAPFKKLPRYVQRAVEKQAPQVAVFFSLPLLDISFRAPVT